MLSNHPRIKIKNLCATKNIGKKIIFFDKRIKEITINYLCKKINWDDLNLVLSLPNGEAQKLIKKYYFKNLKLKFIDLSADFRLKNTLIYKKNYKKSHKAKNLIKDLYIQFQI